MIQSDHGGVNFKSEYQVGQELEFLAGFLRFDKR